MVLAHSTVLAAPRAGRVVADGEGYPGLSSRSLVSRKRGGQSQEFQFQVSSNEGCCSVVVPDEGGWRMVSAFGLLFRNRCLAHRNRHFHPDVAAKLYSTHRHGAFDKGSVAFEIRSMASRGRAQSVEIGSGQALQPRWKVEGKL